MNRRHYGIIKLTRRKEIENTKYINDAKYDIPIIRINTI